MRPGSVIVDLAAETGGNCELTRPGEVVDDNGVTILGPLNLPSTMPVHASQMYAKNITEPAGPADGQDGDLALDFEDEIVKGTVITRGGEVVHEVTRQRLSEAGMTTSPAGAEAQSPAATTAASPNGHATDAPDTAEAPAGAMLGTVLPTVRPTTPSRGMRPRTSTTCRTAAPTIGRFPSSASRRKRTPRPRDIARRGGSASEDRFETRSPLRDRVQWMMEGEGSAMLALMPKLRSGRR